MEGWPNGEFSVDWEVSSTDTLLTMDIVTEERCYCQDDDGIIITPEEINTSSDCAYYEFSCNNYGYTWCSDKRQAWTFQN